MVANAIAETLDVRPAKRFHLAVQLLTLVATEVHSKSLGQSALIFSPHPDDECLGCGGTILKKKQAGATVKLVHMTDGSGSHPATLISRQELIATRHREALSAAAILGVDDAYFLDFKDQALSTNATDATQRVVEILGKEQPEQIFVPYRREPMAQAADHVATTNIVWSALESYPKPVMVWEYPVWYWFHWPWVGFQKGCLGRRYLAKNSLKLMFGCHALLELRNSVNIQDVLRKKIAALAEHRSQMTELVPNPAWTTLGKVSGGEWLEMFCLDYEFFRCTLHHPHA